MAISVLFIGHITDSASSRPDSELITGLHHRGVEIDVIMPPGSLYEKRFIELGIRVIPFHLKRKFSLKGISLIRYNIRIRKYKIIHLFNSKAIVNGAFAAIGLPVKVIAYRGAAGIYWYDPTAWLSHLNPRIDVVICNSNYVWQHMRKQLLFNRNKAVMIHKGMDTGWFTQVIAIKREELHIPENSIIAGCVANFRRIKGVPYLIESTFHLDPALPLHFLLIGSGMKSKRMMHLIAKSPLKDRIHILGFRPDIYKLLAACDIYIQPSINESLSRSVMEAMCLGVPCIVTDTGGLTELVENEKSGLLVEKRSADSIAKAIMKLINEPSLRKVLSSGAINRMQNFFSVENMVRNTAQLYEKMIR
jgi:glycosyltransferase involved in cell wall biosynthesis